MQFFKYKWYIKAKQHIQTHHPFSNSKKTNEKKNIYSAAFLYFFLFSSHEWSVFVLFSFWEEVFEENIRNSNRRSNLQNIRFFSTAFFTTPPCGWLQIFPRLITRSAVYYKVRGWLQIKTPEFIWRRQVWFQQPCEL